MKPQGTLKRNQVIAKYIWKDFVEQRRPLSGSQGGQHRRTVSSSHGNDWTNLERRDYRIAVGRLIVMRNLEESKAALKAFATVFFSEHWH